MIHFFLLFLVLSLGDGENETVSTPDLTKCGINYCPAPAANNTDEDIENEDNFGASRYQLFILAGVYLACSILSAVVVALFVDPLSKYVPTYFSKDYSF